MGPYRTIPLRPAQPEHRGFPWCTQRLGRDRFEISFLPSNALVGVFVWIYCAVGLACSMVLLPFIGFSPAFALPAVVVLSILAVVTERKRFIVTRDDSWVQLEVLGVPLRRERLGRKPTVQNLGWDWEELAIYSADPALKRALHDGERAVLTEWGDGDATRDREGAFLEGLIRAEIERLHA